MVDATRSEELFASLIEAMTAPADWAGHKSLELCMDELREYVESLEDEVLRLSKGD